MNKNFLVAILSLTILFSCKTTKETVQKKELPEIVVKPEQKIYQASNTRVNDVVHMTLNVSFDWDKKQLIGQEWLTVQPHFYPVNHLDLNARGMTINTVSLGGENQNEKKRLAYDYRSDSLIINLDHEYTRNEKYIIYIDYIAKPEELKQLGGSAAITSDKGLYFINADGKEFGKPKQVWTQGETQSNSTWFPIIDSPNQRMTEEINISVDSALTTLSNGLLINSTFSDNNKTRTDHWKQTLPAAPYLSMMAVSNFKIVKDKWRNIEVNYYVDSEYEPYAKQIFGNTPQMLEFFSNKLGVDYAWEKFSQVVVHDYVSGAMENTSAVLHGEFLQRTARELLDNTNEDVISHELFHQWFGDLVTCESWSNIPLNESFATYGEYLWNEFKYGREEADYGINQDLGVYLSQAKYSRHNLIYFDYKDREDVFDGHSYAKGGRILHMLRKYVGDDAFFSSLKKYLTDNRFKAVEAHNLRLAFEEVTGEDLNWFFNQWFFAQGHPELEISYQWIDSLKKEIVTIEQKQNFEKTPLYKLPLTIDIYESGIVRHEKAPLENAKEILFFDCKTKPELINADAEKQLLCTKTDNHTNEEWAFMYRHAPLYMDRYEAIQKMSKLVDVNNEAVKVISEALHDKHFSIRNMAIKAVEKMKKEDREKIKPVLMELASKDEKSSVRKTALASLVKNYEGDEVNNVLQNAINDSSYSVFSYALEQYTDKNKKEGLAITKKFENDNSSEVISALCAVYAKQGDESNLDYMMSKGNYIQGFGKIHYAENFGKFLLLCSPENIDRGKVKLIDIATGTAQWFIKLQAKTALTDLSAGIDEKIKKLSPQTEFDLINKYKATKENINKAVDEIKKNEKDPKLIKIYNK